MSHENKAQPAAPQNAMTPQAEETRSLGDFLVQTLAQIPTPEAPKPAPSSEGTGNAGGTSSGGGAGANK